MTVLQKTHRITSGRRNSQELFTREYNRTLIGHAIDFSLAADNRYQPTSSSFLCLCHFTYWVIDFWYFTPDQPCSYSWDASPCGSAGRASDRHSFDSPWRQGIFLPESAFSADSVTCVRTSPCAIACVDICAHVKDPVVHVGVRWIMKTLKHPACTVSLVARLSRSWLSSEKATRIVHGKIHDRTIQL